MKGTEKSTKVIRKAKINGNRHGYEEAVANYNEWLDIPPYAVLQDVLIQDIKGNVTLGWVESRIYEDLNDGSYKVGGIQGGPGSQLLKCYMLIPFPFEGSTYWNWAYDDYIRELYKDFNITTAERQNDLSKGAYKELIITNY